MFLSSRLSFEALTEQHADELFEAFLPPQIYDFLPELPPRSLESMREEYREFSSGAPAGSGEIWLNRAVRDTSTQCAIGKLQATVFSDGLLWIGYKFTPVTAGRGLGTEAVQWLVAVLSARLPNKPVLAAVDTRNTASVRVLQKAGFNLLRREPADIRGCPSEDYVFQSVKLAPPSEA